MMETADLVLPQRAALPLGVEIEPRVCGQAVVDVTVGCSFGCIYCPFADQRARRVGVSHPTVRDTSAIMNRPAPPSVYFSASSDAFAPQAAPHTHDLLAHWLPRGTVVGIVTKGIIPDCTVDLLARFRSQIEGVSIGVASLDAHRNRLIEPGVPAAAERLALIERLAAGGLPVVLRMDPLFPGVDDDMNALAALIVEAEKRGAWAVAAGYVFSWGRYLRRLRREPLLAAACQLLTERAPMAGGVGWSVPLARKIDLYTRLAELARSHGLFFQTCGCKDLRLHETSGLFATRCCQNPFFTQTLPIAGSGSSGLRTDDGRSTARIG
jgi:hypothetical protein